MRQPRRLLWGKPAVRRSQRKQRTELGKLSAERRDLCVAKIIIDEGLSAHAHIVRESVASGSSTLCSEREKALTGLTSLLEARSFARWRDGVNRLNVVIGAHRHDAAYRNAGAAHRYVAAKRIGRSARPTPFTHPLKRFLRTSSASH
jgi:hypothetical protein